MVYKHKIGMNGGVIVKVGILGGLLMGGLLGTVLIGIFPGLLLLGLGAVFAGAELYREHAAQRKAARWRARYPSYKY